MLKLESFLQKHLDRYCIMRVLFSLCPVFSVLYSLCQGLQYKRDPSWRSSFHGSTQQGRACRTNSHEAQAAKLKVHPVTSCNALQVPMGKFPGNHLVKCWRSGWLSPIRRIMKTFFFSYSANPFRNVMLYHGWPSFAHFAISGWPNLPRRRTSKNLWSAA